MERIDKCLVNMWGRSVGILTWNPISNTAAFQYTPEFCNSGLEISPLKMPLSDRVYEFPELKENELSSTFLGLPGIFADSLPEKYGNKIMKEWLRRQNIEFSDLNPVERLCYVGSRGMGALEYEPVIEFVKNKTEIIDFNELVDIARTIILNEENKEIPVDENSALIEQLIRISTSAGGAKAKALVALKIENGIPVKVYSGQAEPKKELSYWLVKFSDVKNDEHHSDKNTGRIEYAYYLMAKAAGITMMDSRLLNDNNGTGHFITQRFDRINGTKLHMASLCGLAHYDRNPPGMIGYEDLFNAARKLKISHDGIEQLYRRMVFNILARNQDDHTKNHSFIMQGDGKWNISPAYDVCFSYDKKSKFIALQQMSCNGKRDNFTFSDLIQAGKHAEISNPKKIIAEVLDALASWGEFARKAKLPEPEADAVKMHFRNDICLPSVRKKKKPDDKDDDFGY